VPMHPYFATKVAPMLDASLDFEAKIAAFMAMDSDYSSPAVETEDIVIPGTDVKIPARLYQQAGNQNLLPGLVWFHGGGFVQGGLWQNESDVVAREMAHRTPMVVLAVEYRLCNDGVTFPAPFTDGLDALKWFAANSERLNVDPKRIFIGGISAGGSLAATVSVLNRDLGLNLLAGQLLNCPTLHHKLPTPTAELQSKLDQYPGFGLTAEYVEERNRNVCGGEPAGTPSWWFPGELEDLGDLVPAQIINCEFDALRASGEKYAEQLVAAGNSVELSYEPGTPHAHLNRHPQECEPMDLTLDSMVDFIQRH
jgi:acetyl esterase